MWIFISFILFKIVYNTFAYKGRSNNFKFLTKSGMWIYNIEVRVRVYLKRTSLTLVSGIWWLETDCCGCMKNLGIKVTKYCISYKIFAKPIFNLWMEHDITQCNPFIINTTHDHTWVLCNILVHGNLFKIFHHSIDKNEIQNYKIICNTIVVLHTGFRGLIMKIIQLNLLLLSIICIQFC